MSTSARTYVRGAAAHPVIGKDVLELVSTAMYVDPLTIYREYVQNAADAIDAARADGTKARDEPGRVKITLDTSTRSIVIRDNGGGLPADAFPAVLTSIGASSKRGTGARGFRGVGRLSGLAYARELTFRSSAKGSSEISSITWDCRELRAALRGLDDQRDLAEVVAAITATTREPGAEADEHFFEVVLSGVTRQGDDRLMSPDAVANYLSQVAPVPFSPAFSLGSEIAERLGHLVRFGALDIAVNDMDSLVRPFRDEMPVEGGRPLRLREADFIEVPGIDGEIVAAGWVAHHDYEGAVHSSTSVRGLRARIGDVQVGDGLIFEDVFPEARFNAWAVGEIHVLDERIVPNGRRDDFERNVHLANLKNHLSPLARQIAVRCRTSSRERKRLRDIELEHAAIAEHLSVLEQGSLGARSMEGIALSIDLAIMRLEKLLGVETLVDDGLKSARARIERARTDLARLMGNDDGARKSPLDRVPSKRRAQYEEMFALIYECSTNRAAAKALVDRILLKLG